MAGRACGPGFHGRVRRGHSHPYGPWPVPLVCGSARAHAGTGDQRRRRRHDPLRWRRHRPAADPGTRPGVLRVRRATRSATVIPVATSRRNRPAPGPQPRGRRVVVNTRRAHAHGHRRPGKQLRHRDPLRGSWRRPAGGADPRLSAQRPCLGQAGPGAARGRLPGHHLRPARVRPVQPAGHRLRLRHLRRRPAAPCWSTWTCATPSWSGTRWAPARSPATWAATGRRGWPRACWSPRSRRTCCRPADNPDGVPQALFDGFAAAAQADTPAWMKGFLDNFYNFDTLRGTLVSDQAWQASWNLAVTASAIAAVACIAHLGDRLPRRPPRDRRARSWSSTATPTRSCRWTRPASGCPP